MPKLILTLLVAGLVAQAQPPLVFEVASIKPVSQGVGIQTAEAGRLSIRGMTLQELIRFAYGGGPIEGAVSGGPKWINDTSERFALEAQGPATSTLADIKRMLQTLLADRFALKLHRETKEVTGYALVLARSDWKQGPNMTEVTGKPCAGATATDANAPRCGLRIFPFAGTGGFVLSAAKMKHLADLLSIPLFELGRPVVDGTGLQGEFDILLDFARRVQKPDGTTAPADLLKGPSLATALREQLGLKLDSVRVETETIVVDSAEKPGEN
jgi:uncharacterized protein (TIGR03435 family)